MCFDKKAVAFRGIETHSSLMYLQDVHVKANPNKWLLGGDRDTMDGIQRIGNEFKICLQRLSEKE